MWSAIRRCFDADPDLDRHQNRNSDLDLDPDQHQNDVDPQDHNTGCGSVSSTGSLHGVPGQYSNPRKPYSRPAH